jgi:hypothetical protein
MDIIKPGITYKIYNYSDKNKYTVIRFVEKVHKKVVLQEPTTKELFVDGIVEFSDGTSNEEIWFMMLDRYKHLNEKHYSKLNEKIIEYLKEIIKVTKERRKIKQENKKKYEENFQTEVKEFKE